MVFLHRSLASLRPQLSDLVTVRLYSVCITEAKQTNECDLLLHTQCHTGAEELEQKSDTSRVAHKTDIGYARAASPDRYTLFF